MIHAKDEEGEEERKSIRFRSWLPYKEGKQATLERFVAVAL